MQQRNLNSTYSQHRLVSESGVEKFLLLSKPFFTPKNLLGHPYQYTANKSTKTDVQRECNFWKEQNRDNASKTINNNITKAWTNRVEITGHKLHSLSWTAYLYSQTT